MNGIITIDKAKKMSQIYRQIPENLIDRYKITEAVYDDINEAWLQFTVSNGSWNVMIDASTQLQMDDCTVVIRSKNIRLTMFREVNEFTLVMI